MACMCEELIQLALPGFHGKDTIILSSGRRWRLGLHLNSSIQHVWNSILCTPNMCWSQKEINYYLLRFNFANSCYLFSNLNLTFFFTVLIKCLQNPVLTSVSFCKLRYSFMNCCKWSVARSLKPPNKNITILNKLYTKFIYSLITDISACSGSNLFGTYRWQMASKYTCLR